MTKTVLKLKLVSLTPVHIGAAQEKHLAKGVDYLAKDGTILFLDESKILEKLKVHEYCNDLSNRKLQTTLEQRGIEQFVKQAVPIAGEIGTDIKIHVKDTLTLNPYIPGTSLKGAIRSILFHSAKKKEHRKEQETFGWIQEDGFRYLQVGDSHFEASTYINTKTFNLMKRGHEFDGGWKGSNQTNPDFSPKEFTFPYECIGIHQMSEVRIVMNSAGYQEAANRTDYRRNPLVKEVNTLSQVLANKKTLFQIIQTYTDQYLRAEIDFFTRYSNQQTDTIIAELTSLKKKNSQAPVIRVGQGSGFHSITGNHHFPTDHSINGINNWGKGQLNGRDSAKSRKLAFERINDEYVFYPMGFVQLIDPEVHQEYYASLQSQIKQKKDEIIALEAKAEEQRKAEQEKIRVEAEEAKKPKMTLLSQLNNRKAILIDAIVTRKDGNNVLATPQVETMLETTISVRYPAGFPIGSTIQIKAKYSNGTLLVEGSPKLKK